MEVPGSLEAGNPSNAIGHQFNDFATVERLHAAGDIVQVCFVSPS